MLLHLFRQPLLAENGCKFLGYARLKARLAQHHKLKESQRKTAKGVRQRVRLPQNAKVEEEVVYLLFFFTFSAFSFASGLNKFCFRHETQALSIV
jgi:hypothetical protein